MIRLEDGTYKESCIVINGQKLTDQQTMTIRFALEHHLDDLINNGLGNDEHGIDMCQITIKRISEIKKIIYHL